MSSCQGTIDWQALVAAHPEIRFTYIKCGSGNDKNPNGTWSKDPFFTANVAGARAAGLFVGLYNVVYPLTPDAAHPGRAPEEQAQIHFDLSGGLGAGDGMLPPAMDLEWPVPGTPEWAKYGCTPASVRAWALAYLQAAEALWGVLPVLYNGFPIYWKQIEGASEPGFARYPLWNVEYSAAAHPPGPWTDYTFWQTTGGGASYAGIPDKVDTDEFNGDEDALRAFVAGNLPT